MATKGPLDGIKVLDLSWILSGPFATMTLSDLGATVVKVERPPYGDLGRTTRPIIDGESGYFFSVNRGKKSISIDLKTIEGKQIFLDLVKEFDVIVENFTPGVMDKIGLSYQEISAVNEKIIYAAISGYGQTGPWKDRPALDVIAQGSGGILSVTGVDGGPPIRPGTSLGDIGGGIYCVIGVLSAVIERNQSGKGQYIDISMMDCQIAIQENAFMRWHLTNEEPKKLGTRHPTAVPFQAFPTSDGWIVVALSWGVPEQWNLLCSVLGLDSMILDDRFTTAEKRTDNHAELEPILNEAFKMKTTDEWIEMLLPMHIPCGPVNSIKQVSESDQANAREMFVEVEHKTLGNVRLVNSPIKLSRTPAKIQGTAPDMGQHTNEVLESLLGLSQEAINELIDKNIVWDKRAEPDLE
ncbi:MAG: carnitine dehydratase [Chloroflexi bacterium]|nr:carnitine dehydratase [Chloroflexota bacterium]|tara:strand:+ start:14253 stop:15482 length:1230 start_codon:yes stop_codon:yes gene_type:complete